ncbi:flagellar hook-basal body complex protein [Rhodobacteraceae bacterium N5(2021)]|uniref:Flagellar basal-body rod protein FlgF n=1 Tax=Gymnodinialimonas phycosphaerae TaxID=2841589 RepID=A0A975YEU1_9RHOB|nr:flagellar hook-basal body complex protein [Gymnodinialimonas phycosphaerae]MBY4894067.1 flagellar hook-basal body complex protein [Gymnodinialimonas phycosphaerae]
MDNAGYTSLTRLSGLMREMSVVANNIANISTTGFRSEGLIFAEHIAVTGPRDPSLSMGTAIAHSISAQQGALEQTGSEFDLAIEGEGFFLIDTPDGEALSRAGAFIRNDAGELVTPDGNYLLDAGGAPVFVPPQASAVAVAPDGTISADGQPLTVVGLYMPNDPLELTRRAGTTFTVESGVRPAENARVLQGFLEQSNVDPMMQVARMIEVQRAYELGQSFMDAEDNRIRDFLRTAGQRS